MNRNESQAINPVNNQSGKTGARVERTRPLNPQKNFAPGSAKIPFSCRISPLVKSLIALERRKNNCASDGEALGLIVLRASAESPKAVELIKQAVEEDPLMSAMFNAVTKQTGNFGLPK